MERSVFIQLQLGHRPSRDALNKALARFGLDDRHVEVLLAIKTGPATQHKLSAKLALHKSSIVSLVDTLEELRLATREKRPDDRRVNFVQITNLGRRRLRYATKIIRENNRRFFQFLDEDDADRIRYILQQAAARRDRCKRAL